MSKSIEWDSLLAEKSNVERLRRFANGDLSGRDLLSSFAFTPVAGVVRSLVRGKGVDKGRKLTRQALSRRNLM